MEKILISFLIGISALTCKWDHLESINTVNQSDIESKIDQQIKKYEDLKIFSGVVLLAEEGKPIYHKAFGMADREKKIANTTNTLFDIGSMNKTFTSIVIKQLIYEGKLKYSSKLTDHISGFQDPNTKKIDVRHLLNHESGFGDYHDDEYFDAPKSEKTLQKIVEKAKSTRLYFDPGTEQEYSNTGYVLLGAIIEKVTGKSYFDNVKKRIIEPLELKNTYVEHLEKQSDRVAHGYFYSPLGILEKNESLQDEPNPDGGFLSTTEDIVTFYRSYYYDTVLLTEEIKKKDQFFQYIRSLPKGKAPLSAGGFEGFNTAMYHVLSDDRSIVVFANMDEPVAERIADDILDITRGQQPAEPKRPAIQNVRIAFEEKGAEYIKANFEDLTENYHPEDPKDWILNDLGYAFLFGKNDPNSALKLFELNTQLFPEIANTWDSLGEAYFNNGDKVKSKECYQKALKLNPDMESAKEKLSQM